MSKAMAPVGEAYVKWFHETNVWKGMTWHGIRTLKLNLGCGDKILGGYVNVDVVEARAGMRPDVICDLHDLAPFSSA